MKLGKVIERLEAVKNKNVVIENGFSTPHSYRGYYTCVAFYPEKNSVFMMLEDAKSALNKWFTGWKGGDFFMSAKTEVYIANEGGCGELLTEEMLEKMLGGVCEARTN